MDSDDLLRHLRRDQPSIWERLAGAARKAEPLTRESFDRACERLRVRAALGETGYHAKVSELMETMNAEIERYARELLLVVGADRLALERRDGGGLRLTVDGRPALDMWIDWPELGSDDYSVTVMGQRHPLALGSGEPRSFGGSDG